MGDPLDIDTRRAISDRFARNLVAARKDAGFSQEALAFEASVHRTQVGMLERGARLPRLDTLVKLAAVLGVSLDELAQGIEWQRSGGVGGVFVTPGEKP
jgi:transcriptional regulator with XRE-family HTH domain